MYGCKLLCAPPPPVAFVVIVNEGSVLSDADGMLCNSSSPLPLNEDVWVCDGISDTDSV